MAATGCGLLSTAMLFLNPIPCLRLKAQALPELAKPFHPAAFPIAFPHCVSQLCNCERALALAPMEPLPPGNKQANFGRRSGPLSLLASLDLPHPAGCRRVLGAAEDFLLTADSLFEPHFAQNLPCQSFGFRMTCRLLPTRPNDRKCNASQ